MAIILISYSHFEICRNMQISVFFLSFYLFFLYVKWKSKKTEEDGNETNFDHANISYFAAGNLLLFFRAAAKNSFLSFRFWSCILPKTRIHDYHRARCIRLRYWEIDILRAWVMCICFVQNLDLLLISCEKHLLYGKVYIFMFYV